MTSHPPSTSKPTPKKLTKAEMIRKSKAKAEPELEGKLLDKHSTEAIALQLLDPFVSETEEAEYQGCVLVHPIFSGLLPTNTHMQVYRSMR